MQLVNIALLRHPTNWLIVFVMLLMWMFAVDLIHAYGTGRHPAAAA